MAMLLASFAATAAAVPPVGQDGQIHACYRVKGKPKGGPRVVSSAKKRCKSGERKVTWSVAGTGGQVGAGGQSGSGRPRPAVSLGRPGSTAPTEAKPPW
jgi:hypothetical protein